MKQPSVYVVDDDSRLAETLKKILSCVGYACDVFLDGQSALHAVEVRPPDLVLLDLKLPDTDGIEVLKQIRRKSQDLPVVMMSGEGTIKTAVEATRLGAFDFIEKPLDSNRVKVTIRNALEHGQLKSHVRRIQVEQAERYRMCGNSIGLQRVRETVARVAATNAGVLIFGESGVGKELVARALHVQSFRAQEPFVAINCAAIPKDLIESEMFGYDKGAFTDAKANRRGKLEEADRGTLFLDEVGDLSLPAQAKLLRFIEDSEVTHLGANRSLAVDVRIVSATNKDLPAAIRQGVFRDDLYHRLNVVGIEVPPLRTRLEDIGPLIELFLDRYRSRHNRRLTVSPECLPLLKAYDWPGNVRELRNLVERVVILAQTNPLEPEELRTFIPTPVLPGTDGSLKSALEKAEREAVERALSAAGANVSQAARILGIERPSLHRIIRRYGIKTPEQDG